MIKVTTEMHRVLKLDIYVFIVSSSVLGILYIFTIEATKTPITLNFACKAATSISSNDRGGGGGGRRCHDRMEDGFSTPCSISAHHH